uniref:Putative salp15 n=1 Tax=Ixodes ricinus TaxID=34613 RepID=A0A0K8RIV0_IXORI
MAGNKRMIAALLVLFLHSLQITSADDPIIKGNFEDLAPKCEEQVKNIIKGIRDATEATLRLRYCEIHVVRQTSTGKMQLWRRLPDGFPCAFGSICDGGECKCSGCP